MRALLFCSVYNYNTSPQTGAGPAAAQASRDIRPAGRLAATTTGTRGIIARSGRCVGYAHTVIPRSGFCTKQTGV